jgi:hypothetical protein
VSSLGALVCGRTLFEVTEGWQGRHTLDVPVVVVTHRVPTDWIDAGNRPFFGNLTAADALLDNPTVCIQGDRVTHFVLPAVR